MYFFEIVIQVMAQQTTGLVLTKDREASRTDIFCGNSMYY